MIHLNQYLKLLLKYFRTFNKYLFEILLELFGQKWIKTLSPATLLFLPLITYITSVISGNIALSLGMVGALSIVRFRNLLDHL